MDGGEGGWNTLTTIYSQPESLGMNLNREEGSPKILIDGNAPYIVSEVLYSMREALRIRLQLPRCISLFGGPAVLRMRDTYSLVIMEWLQIII